MARFTDSPIRLLLTIALAATLVIALASLLAGTVSAAPMDDVAVGDDPAVVVDELTETPNASTEGDLDVGAGTDTGIDPEVDPGWGPVAMPSASPVPTRDPFEVTGDGPVVADPGFPTGPSDLSLAYEVCNPPVADQIDDLWCNPVASETEAELYDTSAATFTVYYVGSLPTDLIDILAGPYLLTVGLLPPSTKIKSICRIEDGFGNLLDTLTGTIGALDLTIGNELVYRCTIYQLPDVRTPDTLQTTDGPADLRITDIWCPPGTDPALNFYGLIGRCHQRNTAKDWEARTAGGDYEYGEVIDDGVARLDLYGDTWTVTTSYPTGSFSPPVLYCNVRDELGNEPPVYAPFMTYRYGTTGAVIALEQYLSWDCVSYTIPLDAGTGGDVAHVSVTSRACPQGTVAPTVAACGETLAGVTVRQLIWRSTSSEASIWAS